MTASTAPARTASERAGRGPHPAARLIPGTAQGQVIEWLREAIITGELRPGDRVPQESVARRIGVSVIPVREALTVLEGEGQIIYRPRRGYFVAELAIEDVLEIYELRRLLEERAVRLALPELDDDAIEQMERAAEDCIAYGRAGEIVRELDSNRRFHFTLLEAQGQPHLMRLIRLLWDSTEAYRAVYYNSPLERRAADAAHRRILDAVRARDAVRVVDELDAHRGRALDKLREILAA